jgi:hypothetical protein
MSEINYENLAKERYDSSICALKEDNISWKSFCNRVKNFYEISNISSREMIYNYSRDGKLFELKLLTKLNPMFKPNIYDLNVAALAGHTDVIKWIIQEHHIMPTSQTANDAARNGNIYILFELAKTNIFPDRHGLYFAAMNGYLDILKFALEHEILPDSDVVDIATARGQVEVVKFLISLAPPQVPIFPCQDAVNMAEERKFTDVLELLAKYNILPERDLFHRLISYQTCIIPREWRY